MNVLLQSIFQIIAGLLFAPLLAGLIKKIKARMQHRIGPPIFQPFFDLVKLFRKSVMVSDVTSWIFKTAPFIEFGVAIVLLAAIPCQPGNLFPGMDLLLILYLWGLARFFSALAGLDAGSSFGGMGSSREVTLAALIEPGMILALFLVGMKAATINAARVFFWTAHDPGWFFSPVYLFVAGSFLILLIAETGRIPVDNPDTHLELTMIHEGMILEYSGPYLALINLAFWIRQYLFYVIFVNLFLPGYLKGGGIGILIFNFFFLLAKVGLVGVTVAIAESSLAKMRLIKVSKLLWFAFAMSVMGLLTVVF